MLMRPMNTMTPSPGNFQEAKAYLHVLGQQRSPSTMSALCHAKCRVLLWSHLELLCGADTVACLQPCCTAIQ